MSDCGECQLILMWPRGKWDTARSDDELSKASPFNASSTFAATHLKGSTQAKKNSHTHQPERRGFTVNCKRSFWGSSSSRFLVTNKPGVVLVSFDWKCVRWSCHLRTPISARFQFSVQTTEIKKCFWVCWKMTHLYRIHLQIIVFKIRTQIPVHTLSMLRCINAG